MGRRVDRLRHKLVPRVRKHTAFGRDRTEQSVEHEQRAGHRPAVTDARSHAAPVVTAQFCPRRCHQFRNLFDRFCVDPGFFGGEFESVRTVEFFQEALKFFEPRLFDKVRFAGLVIAP